MRPTKAEVRLDAIVNNYRVAVRFAPGSQSLAVIKANAYGHGMVEVARALEPEAPAFAVAFIDEACQLRDAGIRKPILVLHGATCAADIAEAVRQDFWLLMHHQQQIDWAVSAFCPGRVKIWLKVESGMQNLGFRPEALDRVCAEIRSSQQIQPGVVLCTQLACADNLADPMTGQQLKIMQTCANKFGFDMSIANSAAIMSWPKTHAEWNRPGYMLYGNNPMESYGSETFGLIPAMTMKSELIAIKQLKSGECVGYGQTWQAEKDSTVGTIAIGYGDGYPRHAPNGTPVLVNGKRVPLIGRVSMDLICVDLADIENGKVGDQVELWGQELSVNEVAAFAGTIGYELLAGLSGRVPLEFIGK